MHEVQFQNFEDGNNRDYSNNPIEPNLAKINKFDGNGRQLGFEAIV